MGGPQGGRATQALNRNLESLILSGSDAKGHRQLVKSNLLKNRLGLTETPIDPIDLTVSVVTRF